MHDWSDRELDKLSREAADNYKPGREAPDWELLKDRLDDELPVGKEANKRRFIVFLLLFLLLGGAGYLLFDYAASNDRKTEILNQIDTNTSEKDNSKSVDQKAAGINSETIATQSETAKNNKRESGKTNNEQNQPDVTNSPLSLKKQAGNVLDYPFSNSSKKSIYGQQKKQGIKNKTQKQAEEEMVNIEIENGSVGEKAITGSVAPANDNTTQSAPEQASTNNDKKPAANDDIANDSSATATKKNPEKIKSKSNKGFEVGVLTGVDLSNVKFKYTDKAGINIGLTAGYRFNKRWTISTGLIYTKKNYTAEGEDFHPPKNYWTANYKLDSVRGSCYMLELPLYATYRFATGKKSGWFATAGLSTYFMKKEKYTYYYKYMNGTPASRNWENPDPGNYWFSVLSISAGWEKNIGNNFTLGISPYAKVPLKGLGFGNMDLSSYGLNLLLNFRTTKRQ